MHTEIDIVSFLKTHKKFDSIKSWTKEKHKLKNLIFSQINNKNTIQLEIHCRSVNCLTLGSHYFLFIKINSERKGLLRQFRNKWIFVYSVRERYCMNYTINHLPDDFEPKFIFDIAETLNIDLSNQIVAKDSFNQKLRFIN